MEPAVQAESSGESLEACLSHPTSQVLANTVSSPIKIYPGSGSYLGFSTVTPWSGDHHFCLESSAAPRNHLSLQILRVWGKAWGSAFLAGSSHADVASSVEFTSYALPTFSSVARGILQTKIRSNHSPTQPTTAPTPNNFPSNRELYPKCQPDPQISAQPGSGLPPQPQC